MAGSHSTPSHAVIVSPYANEEPMPAGATGTLFLLASGFGIGALVILFAFVFLIGIGGVGHNATSGPTAAQQSAATAPAAPRPAPNPEPNTGGGNGAGNDARTGQSQHAARRPWDRSKTLSGHSGTARSDGLGIQKCIQNAPLDSGLRSSVGLGMTLLNPDGISRADGARQRCAAPCR